MTEKVNRRMNTTSIKECRKLMESLDIILESYGIKKNYIIKESKIPRTTFYEKLAKKSFTLDELEAIADVVNR